MSEQPLLSIIKSSAATAASCGTKFDKKQLAGLENRIDRHRLAANLTTKSIKQKAGQSPLNPGLPVRALLFPKYPLACQHVRPELAEYWPDMKRDKHVEFKADEDNLSWHDNCQENDTCQGCRELQSQIENQAKTIVKAVAAIEELKKLVNSSKKSNNQTLSLQENLMSSSKAVQQRRHNLASSSKVKNFAQGQQECAEVGSKSDQTYKPLQQPESQCNNYRATEKAHKNLRQQSPSTGEGRCNIQSMGQSNNSEERTKWEIRLKELEDYSQRLEDLLEQEDAKSEALSQRLKIVEDSVQSNEGGMTLAERVDILVAETLFMHRYHRLLRRLLLLETTSKASSAELEKLKKAVAKLDKDSAKLSHFDRLVRRGDKLAERINEIQSVLPSVSTCEQAHEQREQIKELDGKIRCLQMTAGTDAQARIDIRHVCDKLDTEVDLQCQTLELLEQQHKDIQLLQQETKLSFKALNALKQQPRLFAEGKLFLHIAADPIQTEQ